MRPQPLIAVRDVEASSRWYQEVLGCDSGHGGSEYERLLVNGDLVMQLHDRTDHEHGNLEDPSVPAANGRPAHREFGCVTSTVTRECRTADLCAQVAE